MMKQRIYELLSEHLPLVDLQSDFLFSELDSLGVVTIMMVLEKEFKVPFKSTDATPKNLKSLDAIVKMVEDKISAAS